MFSHTQSKQKPGDTHIHTFTHTHTSTNTHAMKEVQLEHPTPINQLSKQIHIRPSIVVALENSHLGKQHKSSNCISPLGHMCACVHACVCASVRGSICVHRLAAVTHWHRTWAVMIVVVMGRLCNHWWVERARGRRRGREEAQKRGWKAMKLGGKLLAAAQEAQIRTCSTDMVGCASP